MLNFLPGWLVGFIAMILLTINVLFWAFLIFVVAIFKFLLPFKPLTKLFDKMLWWIAEQWISGNVGWMNLTQKTVWDVQGVDNLKYQGWYLVVCNHQSWADILILQKMFNRRIPFLKFFLKRELIWVPVMGLVWWAVDFPFLNRHSSEYLKKHPEQKGKDYEATRKSCEIFSLVPTSVMNFLEGTRFTKEKHRKQNSPHKYLLKAKAGGIALAMSVLGEKFHSLLNVTIVYPDGIPTFWEFLCGKVKRVIFRASSLEIPPEFLAGDYENDKEFQAAFQQWVQDLWIAKDAQIQALLDEVKSRD
ncbi:MAG TPA: acyltransferase [Smithellaceae bacterium]|jgi:1-acyl-sn-glycerol-3-phosphate acyltransferase|nr:acyltransferase [Smithellaceae bacterium]HQM44506.1 acyltransferase [Smithellaceae bacterium]